MIKKRLENELEKIVALSKRYGAKKVILFGSCLEDPSKAHDIDIAVSGISDREFFSYYGQLSMEMADEIDIVDLNDLPSHFSKRILSRGKVLYER